MWVYLVAVVLIVVGLVGSVAGGGIFTIALVPLGLIALGAAFVFGMFGRGAQDRESSAGGQATDHALPHTPARPTGRAPSSPERLADARRTQQ